MKLKDLVGDVKPLIWASLWMSDLECLEKLVSDAEENQNTIRFVFNGIAADDDFIIKCGL
jgi:hypothetical protein